MKGAAAAWAVAIIALAGASFFGCGARQEEPTVAPPPPPPPPQPRAEPRIWDAQPSYQLGWPIALRVGLLNVGETVVHVPEGQSFGVRIRARRLVPTPPPAESAAGQADSGGGEANAGNGAAAESAGGAEATAGASAESSGGGDATTGAEAQGGQEQTAAAAEPPAPQYEEVPCRDLSPDPTVHDLIPLATTSNTYRRVSLDEQCEFGQAGHYVVELVVQVPDVEGGDVSGDQEPVTLELELTPPNPPLVGRLFLSQQTYQIGQPIEATVRVTNWGEERATVANPRAIQVELEAESQGESVPCTGPGRPRGGRPQRLEHGESVETTVDLASRCQLTLPGVYRITPRIVVPRAGARSFHGTLESPPLTVEVVEASQAPETPQADMVVDEPIGE